MPRRALRFLILAATLAVAAVIVVLVIGRRGRAEWRLQRQRAACATAPLDEVSFAATHNSMSAADQPGWRFTQQERGIGPSSMPASAGC